MGCQGWGKPMGNTALDMLTHWASLCAYSVRYYEKHLQLEIWNEQRETNCTSSSANVLISWKMSIPLPNYFQHYELDFVDTLEFTK